MTRRLRIAVPVFLAVLAVLIASFIALNQYREARFYAVHSYVLSVCSAIDMFHSEHGHFPQSLDQIDKTMLDYDLDIPLQDLDYEITETGYRVSYRISDGRDVSCP